MDVLAAMRVFVRVVERGSLSAAARDLGMGQPAVSERIAKLEEHLGVRLLTRSTRSLSPTAIGTLYYERSKNVIEAASLAETVVAGKSEALQGTLSIAAPYGIGETVLPKILQRFRKQHPHLAIELSLDDRITDTAGEGVDISLRLGDASESGNLARPLGYVRRALVASPEYLAAYGIPLQPEDLSAHSFLKVAGSFKDNTVPLRQGSKLQSYPVNPVWTLSNWRPLHSLLLGGAGIGILQIPTVTEALGAGALVRVLPEYEVPSQSIHLFYPRATPVPIKTKLAVAFLEEEMRFFDVERDLV